MHNIDMMKTMTAKQYQKQFEAEWNEWREMYKNLSPLAQIQVRSGASHRLSKHMEGSGCGISSSDINHEMFNIWKDSGKDVDTYIGTCAELYMERINAS